MDLPTNATQITYTLLCMDGLLAAARRVPVVAIWEEQAAQISIGNPVILDITPIRMEVPELALMIL